jgi:multiple sugar transport system substrate-binding protein
VSTIPLSRRRAIRAAGAAALGLAAGSLLAACGAGATGSVTTSAAAPTSSASLPATSATVAPTSAATSAAVSAATTATTAATTTATAAAASTSAQTTATAAAATSSSAAAAPAAHANAVDFWQWGSGYVPGFDTLVKAYAAANPGKQVVASNPSSYWNKVVATLASGTGPDVFLMNNVNFKQYAKNGSVADLSSYLNADKTASANIKPMLAAAQDWYQYHGKAMGVPWDYSTGVVSYNLDQFRAASLTPPADLGKQWTWSTMRDYATKLTQKQGNTETRSGIWVYNGLENGWYTFAVASGAQFFNANLDQCTISSPEATAGLEFLVSMMKDGTAAPQSYQDVALKANNSDDNGEIFTHGATSMMLDGDWMFTAYEKVKSLSWDSTIFPYAPSGKTANTSNLRGLVMNPAAKQKDQAWAWMAYLMTPDVQNQIPQLLGEVPANNDSAKTYYFDPAKGGPPPGRKSLGPDLDATTPLPASDLVAWGDISNAASKWVGKVYTFSLAPADALKQLQDEINGMISAAKSK